MTQVRRATPDEVATCLAIRHQVFVQEQGVSLADEVDGLDPEATHFLAFHQDQPVGTARLMLVDGVAKLQRVAVLPTARGTGLGQALILGALDHARHLGAVTAKLGAQTHALGFYTALGFTAQGPIYDDAGIPHRDMVLDLRTNS